MTQTQFNLAESKIEFFNCFIVQVKPLVVKTFAHFHSYQNYPCVVQPSLPLLYYGDLIQYLNSKFKVITVGINPSPRLFPAANPYCCFPTTISYKEIITQAKIELYLNLLNSYFENQPYYQWFVGYDYFLKPLKTGYFNAANTAIHLDFCSAIATNPTWTKLQQQQPDLTNRLSQKGREIWHQLIEVLKPDLIVASIGKKYLDQIQFDQLYDWQIFHQVTHTKNATPRKKPYNFNYCQLKLSNQHHCILATGKAGHIPFSLVANSDRLAAGEKLKIIFNSNTQA
jgi:hypothetical protein